MKTTTESLWARAERSAAGRAVISVAVAALLVAIGIWNVPPSALRDDAMPVLRPLMFATGLDQDWAVFAPDPRRVTFFLEARIEFADGSTTTWHPPDRGAYRVYRWRKWVEYARADDRAGQLWRPTAVFVAREHAREGREPVRVTLVRRWTDLPPPGAPPAAPVWNEFEFFTLDVTSEVLA